MGSALASSPQAFFGLIASARDGSRFHRPSDRGSVWVFSITNTGPDATDRASPERLQPSSCFLRRSGQPSVFSRNEGPDEAKPKTACDDDTSRLVKPACIRISTFLHARRHLTMLIKKEIYFLVRNRHLNMNIYYGQNDEIEARIVRVL